MTVTIIKCSCDKASCRMREIKIDPVSRQLWVDVRTEGHAGPTVEAMMHLDGSAFVGLAQVADQGLRGLGVVKKSEEDNLRLRGLLALAWMALEARGVDPSGPLMERIRAEANQCP